MACAAEGDRGGQQLIVRNTFLELFDETPVGPARPRVVSDMTDLRLPHKVQYQHHGNLATDARPVERIGIGAAATPVSSPAVVPLMRVSEEPAPLLLPSGVASNFAAAPTAGYQAYTQMPTGSVSWSTPMPTAASASWPMASGQGAYQSTQAMSPPQCQPGDWIYNSYPGASNGAQFSVAAAPRNLTTSTMMQARPAPVMGSLGAHAPSAMAHQAVSPVTLAAPASMPKAVMAMCGAAQATPSVQAMTLIAGVDCGGAAGQTTVMLRNIPNRYTQIHLIALLDENGFRSIYDFVYLPMDFRNGVNLGYAFVNLLTPEDALRAMTVFQGFSRWFYESNKVCEVSWAHPHQGLEEHVERYRNSPVMHQCMPDEYKPMLFQNGVRIPFPAPTKAIRAPKLRPVRERPAGEA